MTRWRALIDTSWQRTHFGDLIGYLLTHQVSTESNLATLSNKELNRISKT
jgi:hypothetical protein